MAHRRLPRHRLRVPRPRRRCPPDHRRRGAGRESRRMGRGVRGGHARHLPARPRHGPDHHASPQPLPRDRRPGMTDYTPDEAHMEVAWIEYDDSATDINEAVAEFDRFLARVRRDAAREALDGLARESMGAFKSP